MKSQEGNDGTNGSLSSEKLDALLGGWPSPDPEEKGGTSWETRADNIVKAALAGKEQGSAETLTALLVEPALAREPGEENGGALPVESPSRISAMPASMQSSSPPAEGGKRLSLKDLAARASQAGAGRASVTPLPPSIRPSSPDLGSARDSRPSIPAGGGLASVTPIAKARNARASDPGRNVGASRPGAASREDSGVVRLADIQSKQANEAEAKAAAAEAALAAATAKRAEGQAAATGVVAATQAGASSGKGSSTGMWAGVTIAVLGVAAAFAIYKTRSPDAPPPVAMTAQPPSTAAAAATDAPKPQVTAAPTAVAAADPTPEPTAAPALDDPKSAAGGSTPTAAATAVAVADPKGVVSQNTPKPSGSVGTLDEEMKKAVGANDLPSAPQDDGSKPASGGGANVPQQPSQGNAQAAVRAVLPAAKGCVAGASEPTTASITFTSSGAATGVSVGGWAAANGKAGCVKSALMGAHVAPFAKPSFTVPVTVRP